MLLLKYEEADLPNPKELGNAGSFFKNPAENQSRNNIQHEFPGMPKYDLPNGNVKIPAGWLIEQCGWKGKHIGKDCSHANKH